MLQRITIYEYERGLEYRKGRLRRTLAPGRYWIPTWTTKVRRVDVRPRFVAVPGQEVLSSDGVTIRVSLAAEFRIADPVRALNEVESWHDALYVTLQLGLRELIGQTPIDDLLERRGDIGTRLRESATARVADAGIELIDVDVKDIMFSGELKKTFAQVVAARKEGQAALEKARGETAALRNLANAATLVEQHPALIQLRLLQQIAGSSGNTLVLGVGSATPLPVGRAPEPPVIDVPPAAEE